MSAGRPARRLAAGVVAAVAALASIPVAAVAAPAPAAATADFLLPPRAVAFDVGGRLDIDGVPTTTLGFVTRHPPAVVAAWVRERWPAAHTDDRVGTRRVLGRVVGDRHLTLVLEPTADGGTRGLWAAADVRAALRAGAASGPPPGWLPAGSEILQRVGGRDGAGGATTWLVRHGQSPDVVTAHLVRRLGSDRLTLQQRLQPPGSAATWLVFAGPGGQAVAAVAALPGGGSTTALTVTGPGGGR